MVITEKRFLGATLRVWLCIVLLAGGFFLVDGMMQYIQSGLGMAEIVTGGIICAATIVAAAIPPKR